jgi:hypothetical protein
MGGRTNQQYILLNKPRRRDNQAKTTNSEIQARNL